MAAHLNPTTTFIPRICTLGEIEKTLFNAQGSNKEYLPSPIIELCLSYFSKMTLFTPRKLLAYFKDNDEFMIPANEELVIHDIAIPYSFSWNNLSRGKSSDERMIHIINLICGLVGKALIIESKNNYFFQLTPNCITLLSNTPITLRAKTVSELLVKPSQHVIMMIAYHFFTFCTRPNQNLTLFLNEKPKIFIKIIPKKASNVEKSLKVEKTFLQFTRFIPSEWFISRFNIIPKIDVTRIVYKKTWVFKITAQNLTFSLKPFKNIFCLQRHIEVNGMKSQVSHIQKTIKQLEENVTNSI